jgi:Ala-tRNA(Pro) deacylase
MNGDPKLYDILSKLNIGFEYVEHPPAPTIEEAMKYWDGHDATHCKNIFFRNHKGNKHYLVVLDCKQNLKISDLELRLKQGKLTFASEKRLLQYLKLTPGSVTPLGLINDIENHVHVFFDKNLLNSQRISFHPNINTASLIFELTDFLNFMTFTQNSFEFIELY